jgi:hypothetical protein
LLAFLLTSLIFSSCKKDDFTNPENLFGTEWKSMDSDEGVYDLLKFNSKTEVEYLVQEVESDGGKLSTVGEGTYSISGNKIFIDAGYNYELSGTIDGKTMNLDHFGTKKTFKKQ